MRDSNANTLVFWKHNISGVSGGGKILHTKEEAAKFSLLNHYHSKHMTYAYTTLTDDQKKLVTDDKSIEQFNPFINSDSVSATYIESNDFSWSPYPESRWAIDSFSQSLMSTTSNPSIISSEPNDLDSKLRNEKLNRYVKKLFSPSRKLTKNLWVVDDHFSTVVIRRIGKKDSFTKSEEKEILNIFQKLDINLEKITFQKSYISLFYKDGPKICIDLLKSEFIQEFEKPRLANQIFPVTMTIGEKILKLIKLYELRYTSQPEKENPLVYPAVIRALLWKPEKSLKHQLEIIIPIATWHCNKGKGQAWVFFNDKASCEKFSMSLNNIFSAYESSIKASAHTTQDKRFLVKLENVNTRQIQLLAANRPCSKDLQALVSSLSTPIARLELV